MLTKFKCLFLVAWLVFGLCQNVSAELAAKGPINALNNFPLWYMDENGTALQLCLTPTYCTSDPAILSNPYSVVIGFGEKAFYWSAEATLSGSGASGSLFLALVASFSGSTIGFVPALGEQITFFQIAVGPISGLTPGGTYTVTHPFGVLENLVADGTGTIPLQKQDIGCASQPCDFAAVLGTTLGPFLKWDPAVFPYAPVGFIGNPGTAHKVIGSPFGTNFFRIDGPNAGGFMVNTKLTDLFKVQGNQYALAPTPLVVSRATYTRPLPSAVDVSATSKPTATLSVSGAGIITKSMTGDGNGNFFAHIPFSGTPPAVIAVTGAAATVESEVVDVVTITLAEYNADLKTLKIEASSSDRVIPPTLTASVFGNLTAGKLTVTGVLVPPIWVTVTSSVGGSDTARVSVTGNVNPVAWNDTATTFQDTPVTINVLANDTALSGDFKHPDAITITTPPAHGSTSISVDPITSIPYVTYNPSPGFVGNDSFKYTANALIDTILVSSNIATVSITVAASETLTVTKAEYTTFFKMWQISGTTTLKTGNSITLYRGTNLTDPNKIGTASVNFFGGWSFFQFFSPIDPGGATSITARSLPGTVVTFPLTIK